MGRFHAHRFPGESDDYRAARDALLADEIALRKQIAAVAERRRALPTGGAVAEDYVFGAAGGGKLRLSELFGDRKPSLIVYSFMFPPGGSPCPMCTAFLDSLNANAPHVTQRANLAVVAKSPSSNLEKLAGLRGWTNLRLLSSQGNSYNTDYLGASTDGSQWPMLNVFQKTANGISHTWASEMFLADTEPGQHPRHADQLWPLWNFFDLTPDGRQSDWFPQLSYD